MNKQTLKNLSLLGLVTVLLLSFAAAQSPVVNALEGNNAKSIQESIDSLKTPRRHIATVKLVGEFVLESSIRLPSFTRLDLTEAFLERAPAWNGNLIENDDLDQGNERIEILGGMLDGGNKGKTVQDQNGIAMNKVQHLRINGVEVRHCGWAGVRLNGRGTKTRYAHLSQLHLEGNGHSGLTVMWASRNTMVSDILAVQNGAFGIYSDHSEGSYSNIQTNQNHGTGFFIRNIFGSSYMNLTSTQNGKEGILVQGMTHSLGANWASHNNGTKTPGTHSNIVFSDDESLSYGRTANTSITNVSVGDHTQFGKLSSKQGVEYQGGAEFFQTLNVTNVLDSKRE